MKERFLELSIEQLEARCMLNAAADALPVDNGDISEDVTYGICICDRTIYDSPNYTGGDASESGEADATDVSFDLSVDVENVDGNPGEDEILGDDETVSEDELPADDMIFYSLPGEDMIVYLEDVPPADDSGLADDEYFEYDNSDVEDLEVDGGEVEIAGDEVEGDVGEIQVDGSETEVDGGNEVFVELYNDQTFIKDLELSAYDIVPIYYSFRGNFGGSDSPLGPGTQGEEMLSAENAEAASDQPAQSGLSNAVLSDYNFGTQVGSISAVSLNAVVNQPAFNNLAIKAESADVEAESDNDVSVPQTAVPPLATTSNESAATQSEAALAAPSVSGLQIKVQSGL